MNRYHVPYVISAVAWEIAVLVDADKLQLLFGGCLLASWVYWAICMVRS